MAFDNFVKPFISAMLHILCGSIPCIKLWFITCVNGYECSQGQMHTSISHRYSYTYYIYMCITRKLHNTFRTISWMIFRWSIKLIPWSYRIMNCTFLIHIHSATLGTTSYSIKFYACIGHPPNLTEQTTNSSRWQKSNTTRRDSTTLDPLMTTFISNRLTTQFVWGAFQFLIDIVLRVREYLVHLSIFMWEMRYASRNYRF